MRQGVDSHRTTPLTEDHANNRFCNYRTDYGYKDFSKGLAECGEHFAGFFLAYTHKLPPLTKDFTPKITDFGWSNYAKINPRKTYCGTPAYMPPEILMKIPHNEKVDIWCIGVLMFEMLTGYLPFGGNMNTIEDKINSVNISWPRDIDPMAKNLISTILQKEPNKRPSIRQILNHPFFTRFYPDSSSCLILPDYTKKYKSYVISRDSPVGWNSVIMK